MKSRIKNGGINAVIPNISLSAPNGVAACLASALIAQSLQVLKDAGMQEAELGVDSENESAAYQLYQKLGYKTFSIDTWFRKPMDKFSMVQNGILLKQEMDIVHQIIARIPAWQSAREIQIERIAGLTNANYRITVDHECFVLRVSGPNTQLLGINRSHELRALQEVSAVGIAPEMIALSNQKVIW